MIMKFFKQHLPEHLTDAAQTWTFPFVAVAVQSSSRESEGWSQQHQTGIECVRQSHWKGNRGPERGPEQPEQHAECYSRGTADHSRSKPLLSAFISPRFFLLDVLQVDLQLLQLEGKQMDIMMRLQNLSAEAEALRNKTEMNRKMAEDALALANNATLRASSLEQVSALHTWFQTE